LITSADSPPDGNVRECLEVRVVPHPVGRDGTLKIEMNAAVPWMGKIRITDVSGRVILARVFDLPQANGTLDLNAPPKGGLYFIEFIGNNGCRKVVKLVVQ